MKSAFELKKNLTPLAAQYELKSLMEECAVMTDLLANVDDWPQQRLIPIAVALDRRVQQICELYDELH